MNCKAELLNDVPLIVGFCQKLNLSDLLNKHFPSHGSQKGLSNGELILSWIAHILTTNNHCKSPVNNWIYKNRLMIEALLGKKISNTDFEDCRLGRLLEKIAIDSNWHEFEQSFYADVFSILQLNTSPPEDFTESPRPPESEITRTIKIDSTTAYGHHEVFEGGIMQRGWSKDHRPDLPQLKLMVSVEGNTGYQIASDVVPGNRNDDTLYVPIIERTRQIVSTRNCLFCGDSKMSNLSIKANLEKNQEYYLVPLQMHKSEKKEMERMINKIVNEDQEAHLIYDMSDCKTGINKMIGAGFELERNQSFQDDEKLICWNERILLVRSYDHANQEINRYMNNLNKTCAKLRDITSKTCSSEAIANDELINKINEYFENEDTYKIDLFEFEIICEEEIKNIKRCEKRNGKQRNGSYILKKYKSRLVNIKINTEKVNQIKRTIGWRTYVTNAPVSVLSFASAYRFYRKTMYVIEIGFHVLKDYIQISPIFVREENQIIGMTRLLTLALKILTLITAEVRANMKKENAVLVGLYAGQPKRKHPSPTGQSLLEYFTRQCITLICISIESERSWQITPLTDTCRRILSLLRIPEECYTSIPEKLRRLG